MLDISSLMVNYGDINVLNGVNLHVKAGESVIIQGGNGSGKSTLLKAIFNLVPISSGNIDFNGKNIVGVSTNQLLTAGISYIPQENNVFDNLTVKENVLIGNLKRFNSEARKNRLEYIFNEFPSLESKKNSWARFLSGGEKQLVALARVLLDQPKLILLDEPTLGLSEKNANIFLTKITEVHKKYNVAFIIIEHHFEKILPMADNIYILRNKKININNSTS